jgi:ubiquitin carboxyl-terminal hydrolase 7
MCHRVEVTFCDRNVPSDPGFKMVLTHKSNYRDLANRVAERLNTDAECIQFFKSTK